MSKLCTKWYFYAHDCQHNADIIFLNIQRRKICVGNLFKKSKNRVSNLKDNSILKSYLTNFSMTSTINKTINIINLNKLAAI